MKILKNTCTVHIAFIKLICPPSLNILHVKHTEFQYFSYKNNLISPTELITCPLLLHPISLISRFYFHKIISYHWYYVFICLFVVKTNYLNHKRVHPYLGQVLLSIMKSLLHSVPSQSMSVYFSGFFFHQHVLIFDNKENTDTIFFKFPFFWSPRVIINFDLRLCPSLPTQMSKKNPTFEYCKLWQV